MTQQSRRTRWAGAALLGAVLSMAQGNAPDALEQARVLYNQGQYSDAIRLASEARATPAWAPAASVVIARAHLERFRQDWDPADLGAAREALRDVSAAALDATDQVELLVALGESLYLDADYRLSDRFSAAAEQFEVALDHADGLDARRRDLLFDWWAGAIDRQAQRGPEPDRPALYARIVERASRELARDQESPSAAYWLAAGAAGAGDSTRAVGASAAAWVRAGSMGERGVALRLDIERLMLQVVLPARALDLARGADPGPSLTLLETQWDQFRQQWQP